MEIQLLKLGNLNYFLRLQLPKLGSYRLVTDTWVSRLRTRAWSASVKVARCTRPVALRLRTGVTSFVGNGVGSWRRWPLGEALCTRCRYKAASE